jgi:mRNA-decapping enzyme subunit 2
MTKNVFLPRFFLSPLPFAGGSRQAMQVRRQNFFQPPGDSSSRVVSKHRASVIDERGCDDELATGAPGAGERRGEGGETQARGEGTSRCFRDARAFSLCPLPGSSTSAPMAIPRALFRERPRPPLVAPRLTPAFPRARTATSRPTAQGDKKKKAPAPVPVPAVAAGTGGSATGGKKHKLIVRSNDPPGELLEELAARFVLNCPAEELNSFERILFLVEQAHWYYEDFVREENKNLRSMKLREFAELTFHRCAALSKYRGKVDGIYKNFLMYKLSIPTAGLVILNPQMDKVLMVKGWNSGSSWGFPKGKINKNEPERECAAREVFEEVGVDFSGYTNEEDSIVVTRSVDKAGAPGLKQRSRLFIVPNISEETVFVTQTRKEIGSIAWHSLSALVKAGHGKKFFMVGPFLQPLLKWIQAKKKSMGGAHLFKFEGGGLNLGPDAGSVAHGAGQQSTTLAAAPVYLSELEAAARARFPSLESFAFDKARVAAAMA